MGISWESGRVAISPEAISIVLSRSVGTERRPTALERGRTANHNATYSRGRIMGSSRARNSTRVSTASVVQSPPPSSLSDIAAGLSDGLALLETAAAAIEASESQGSAARTLRVGIRAILDAYARLDEAAGLAQGGAP